uniref:Uncharacterized protein n=1 Tax=Meloidogyne javanica TaxID=6303 RepID=A0A915MIU1_MELJA
MSATVSSTCSSSLYSGSLSRRYKRYETNNALSESTHSATTTSLAAVANSAAMITSLTATIDSGLLSRSPSAASTVSGCVANTNNPSGTNYMQSLSQRLEGAERRLLEKEREIQTAKQDTQLARRELDVYKQSLQESERSRDSLTKQCRQFTSELEQIGKKLKEEEEHFQTSQFESRKQSNDFIILKQKIEDLKEENEAEMALEKKRNSEKMEKLVYEYESRIRQFVNAQRSQEQLLERLTESESQLDKTQSQLAHMERLQRTQSAIGETWEAQYRTAQSELEGIRDENAALKSRIRRQKKQIELLTQENELSERVIELETNVGRVQNRLQGDKSVSESCMEPPNGFYVAKEEQKNSGIFVDEERGSEVPIFTYF